MRLVRATAEQTSAVTGLALLLWPENTREVLKKDFREVLSSSENAVFLAYDKETAIGFAQCGLRHDYVEGTCSSPVGYLEGIFVRSENRGRKVASALLGCCMDWSREQGCTEFASDCELTNTASLRFHLQSGFREANRIICFVREL